MSDLADIQEALAIRPGDTFIVRVDRHTSMDQVEKLRDGLRERLPETIDVLIIDAEQLAVLRG